MKYDKWLELREQQESLDSVEKILQSANSAIDKAFSFLINSIKKSYGNKQAMSSGMRDSLIADLRGVMQKISSLEPKVAAESIRLIDKALVIEQEVLGVQGRPVGSQQKYNPEQIMTAIRDRIKSMIRDVVTKVADIKVSGATGQIGKDVTGLKKNVSGIKQGIETLRTGRSNPIEPGSEAEDIGKEQLAKLADFAQRQMPLSNKGKPYRVSVHPSGGGKMDVLKHIDPHDLNSVDKIWHRVSPSKTVIVRYEIPGRKKPIDMGVDITRQYSVDKAIESILKNHPDVPGIRGVI
ncbi:MAG: hypothetical protein ACW987_00570 [Candidatus Thorarchaeota archaeon]|jgi:hypothetical protein